MVDAVGTIGSAMMSGAVRASQSVSSAPKVDDATPAVKSPPPVSPSTSIDSVTGTLITQYLNDSGDVTEQIPSHAAVAYMRIGLTATGTPENSPSDDTVVA